MAKRALITGITGQDGSYLAEHLLEQGYEVHGLTRSADLTRSTSHHWRISHLLDALHLHSASIESAPGLFRVLQEVRPDECYHFAAKSFVSFNFEDEFTTMTANATGTHNLLAALHQVVPECRFYFSGSSEMFGNVNSFPQDENTRFYPRTVYGISKVVGYELTRNYRETYGMYACTGILFNHESPRRGSEFVSRKITLAAARIRCGLQQQLEMGNIDAQRDWGFAGDYVRAVHLMLSQPQPDDFVIGTGRLHTVRDILLIAFNELGLDYEQYLVIDPRFNRPAGNILVANPAKALQKLGWKAEKSFEDMIREMVYADLAYVERQKSR